MTDTQERFRYEFEYVFSMIICIGNQNMASDDLRFCKLCFEDCSIIFSSFCRNT